VESTLSALIASLLRQGGPASWPEAVPAIFRAMSHLVQQAAAAPVGMEPPAGVAAPYADPLKEEIGLTALHTLTFVVEDHAPVLADSMLLDEILPGLCALILHPKSQVRQHALDCIAQAMSLASPGLLQSLDTIAANVFALASDPDVEVRARVIGVLTAFVKTKCDYLQPHLASLMGYMIDQTRVEVEAIAIQACEFWAELSLSDANEEALTADVLQTLLPLLLQRCEYTDEDLADLISEDAFDTGEAIAVNSERNKATIAPTFARAQAPHGAEVNTQGGAVFETRDADSEDEAIAAQTGHYEDEDEAAAAAKAQETYSVRKASASVVDLIGTYLDPRMTLSIFLPLVRERFEYVDADWEKQWRVREVAVLVFGAIADGCEDALMADLPSFYDFLCQSILVPPPVPPQVIGSDLEDFPAENRAQVQEIVATHVHPMLRSITCWSLGRYPDFVSLNANTALPSSIATGTATPLVNVLVERLLTCSTELHIRTQEAAISSLATIVSAARGSLDALAPMMMPICSTLATLFPRYDGKRMILLYDAVGTIADASGSVLAEPQLLQVLLPPLLTRWRSVSREDPALGPLIECVTSIVKALGISAAPFALVIHDRSCEIMEEVLFDEAVYTDAVKAHDEAIAHNLPAPDLPLPPEKECMLYSLELLSALFEALGPAGMDAFAPHIMPSDGSPPRALGLAVGAAGDQVRPDVRQCALAMLGDLYAASGRLVASSAPSILAICEANLDASLSGVCNNATWLVGELCASVSALKNHSNLVRDPHGAELAAEAASGIAQRLPALAPALLQLLRVITARARGQPPTPHDATLASNVAVALARIGLACPGELVSLGMDSFFPIVCMVLRTVRDSPDKESASKGLANMLNIAAQSDLQVARKELIVSLNTS
jgi:hypothetical protein